MGSVKRRVLVVEDESDLRRLFRRRAERAGLQVLEAASCAQGIAVATVEKPDLILVDLHLTDGSGLQLLTQLKADQRTTSIPVIAWSGDDGMVSEAKAIGAGATAYFEKTDLKRLVSTIVELTKPQ